jgi:hypothetical protein
MENLIASDPGGRNVFGLVVPDQLRLAAQSLRLARRVAIVTGFYIPEAGAGETDGPPGAKVLGDALLKLGVTVDYLTDSFNAPLLAALGVDPIVEHAQYLETAKPSHLASIERAARARDGRYRNMRGVDITATTPPLDELFLEAGLRGLTTIGIGDGGNEIGMGKVFAETLATIPHGGDIASIVPTDFCIAAGVSNWGAYGLAGALSILADQDLLPTAGECAGQIDAVVNGGGAVDGVTHRHQSTVDGLPLSDSLRMLEAIRQLIVASPLERRVPVTVGILGYGEAGRAAATLLARHGHRVCISDLKSVSLEAGLSVAGVETGGHTIKFLSQCDLVIASPGVREDTPILNDLHRHGIPVISELELAYQLCPYPLIAVTGTCGKRSTIELMQRIFARAGHSLTIGGNKGRPLSALLLDSALSIDNRQSTIDNPHIALAVSSFQLESIVHFRPHIAVLLNIQEDHLDRHRSIAEYARIKSRIFMNHRPDDILILPYDDPRLRGLARKHQGRTLFISRHHPLDRGAWIENGRIVLNVDGAVEPIAADFASIGDGPPPAEPFVENVLAAILAARLSIATAK